MGARHVDMEAATALPSSLSILGVSCPRLGPLLCPGLWPQMWGFHQMFSESRSLSIVVSSQKLGYPQCSPKEGFLKEEEQAILPGRNKQIFSI